MNKQEETFVRFQDLRSKKSFLGRNFSPEVGLLSGRVRRTISSVSENIHRCFEWATEGTRNIRKSFQFRSPRDSSTDDLGSRKILHPQGEFLQRWNKIFVLSCVMAVSVDPIFFYIPVIDKDKKCLDLDHRLEIAASVLRSFTDIFYILHIFFQFRTGFIAPSSRVFGRGVLVEDPSAIARRYLSSYFLIDILAVLPLPQVVILIIIPELRGSAPLNEKNLLRFVVLFQYVPRLLRIIPLYREVTRSAGIITETAWAGAAFNLFLYMLASHVLGAIWYLLSIERQDTCWRDACKAQGCLIPSLYCKRNITARNDFLVTSCPIDPENATVFDFGIYLSALKSEVVQSRDFPQKFFYCFWWGLQNKNPKNPTNPNKPQKQKNPEKTLNPKSHLLPSNWDRYDDDEVFGNEGSDKSLVDARLAQEIAAPKSKGANFSELIAQAKEDARSRINPDQDFFGSVDDVFSDFYEGVSSMLSVKGNSLLSRSMDDNFIVDDSETSSYEASFLSLDLHALAAQLEKVDVSERLFIESDLLADELGEQLKETSSSRSNYGETSHEGRENSNLGYDHGETSYAVGEHNTEKTRSSNNELVPSPPTSNDNSQEVHDEKPFPPFTWQSGKPNPATDSELFHQNGARGVLNPKSKLDATAELEKTTLRSGATPAETELDMLLNTINEKETKTLGFEAATAEAELDMLLDSFGETKLLDSVDISEEQSSNFPRAQYESSTTSLKESSAFLSTQPVREVPDSFKSPSMTDALDSSIDDLLAQTPIVSNQDHGVHHPLESLTSKGLPSSSPGPKGLDDFDSWLDTL